jgi:hypothetical protein
MAGNKVDKQVKKGWKIIYYKFIFLYALKNIKILFINHLIVI